jgi:hypothetical protein
VYKLKEKPALFSNIKLVPGIQNFVMYIAQHERGAARNRHTRWIQYPAYCGPQRNLVKDLDAAEMKINFMIECFSAAFHYVSTHAQAFQEHSGRRSKNGVRCYTIHRKLGLLCRMLGLLCTILHVNNALIVPCTLTLDVSACGQESNFFKLKRYCCCFRYGVLVHLHSYDLNMSLWNSANKTINLKHVRVLVRKLY